MASLGHPDRF
jgi:hypothetical protein